MNRTNLTVTRRGFLGAVSALAAPLIVQGSAAEPRRLRAGAATSDITLPLGAANGSVISRGGLATDIHDDMHARCLALDDGRTQLVVAICDLRMIGRGVVDAVKRRLSDAIGLAPENVLISATHTHGALAAIGMHAAEIDRWYGEFLVIRIVDGVRRAIANLAPAQIGGAVGSVPEHVFNRRWFMREGTIPADPFGVKGDRVRMNPPRASDDLLKPAGPIDPELALVSVQHADGRPLAVLANYGLHYVGGYERGHVSADYFAVFADRVQQLVGADRLDPPFVAMMSNGTSGNINNIDFRKRGQTYEPWARMREVAYDVADEAFRIYKQIQYREDTQLVVRTKELQLGTRRPDPQRIEWARATLNEDTTPTRLTRPEIYASEVLELAKYPERVPVLLQAIRIGELGIAAVPCEVFAETGLAIKAQSPLRPTFTIELANGYNGYLPTPEQHELGGYETWPARSSYLEVDAETKIRAAVLEMLRETVAEWQNI